ncbi:lactate utilization protein C [Alicyclobacillus cellulosilyticus]|uniref:Lactate utilization protein C n=1 Tax=Alicyclobacillus cellulosilyticus TaxID=1003997 RepID=A0A917K955_9BACL|nr:lactate utilization protein C [Alicyclobacillus cellulosilyticus]
MDEAAFFERIARRLGRSAPLSAPPARDAVGAPEFWQAYQLPEEERIAKFCAELGKLGGHAEVFDSLAALHEGLRRVLRELGPRRIGLVGGGGLAAFALDEVLAEWETVVWPYAGGGELSEEAARAEVLRVFAAADVGITDCDWAVADTGSIVIAADSGRGRSVSLLPSVHIALIRSSQIRTRMGEVLAEVAARRASGGMPSGLFFITGPSRSSDIENDLTIGVHGPAAVVALVLRG